MDVLGLDHDRDFLVVARAVEPLGPHAVVEPAVALLEHQVADAVARLLVEVKAQVVLGPFLLAENDEASPWEPYRVEHGFAPTDTIVAAFSAEGPHSVTNHVSTDTFGIGMSIASCMSTLGSNNAYGMGEVVVVVGPEHAEFFKKESWTKDDLRLYLYQKARNKIGDLMFEQRYGRFYNRMWPKWFDRKRDAEEVPVVVRPDDIHIFVAGGPAGRFSAVIPGWGGLGGRSVIKKVRLPAPASETTDSTSK